MNTCKMLSVRFALDKLFKNEAEFNAFLENHTSVRTIYIESDSGELTKLDIEAMEVDEVVDLSEEY